MPSKQIKIQAPDALHAKLSSLAAAEGIPLATYCVKQLHDAAGVKYTPYKPLFAADVEAARAAQAEGAETKRQRGVIRLTIERKARGKRGRKAGGE
jgi:hypothetical protein